MSAGRPPTQRRKQRKIAYGQIMAAMVLSSLLFTIWTAPFWRIQDTDIRGSSDYTRKYIEAFLNEQHILGRHLLAVDPIQLKLAAEQNPLIQAIQIERQLLPTKLTFKIQERKAAYLVYQQPKNFGPQQSKYFVIDLEGIVLPLPADVVTQKNVQTSIDPSLVHKHLSQDHLELLRHLERLYQQNLISVQGIYNLSDSQNLTLHQKDPPLTVWLGRPEDLPIKLELIEPTLNSSQKNVENIEYIDLRFWKHPVVKTR